jgi:MFS transporter, ACS family, D-galactonate transporter
LGVAWVVVWFIAYRNPNARDAAAIRTGEEVVTQLQTDADTAEIRWVDLFRYRTVWGMMLGFFCMNVGNFFFVTWFPTYLVQARSFSLPNLGTFGTLPALCAIPGGWVGGYVSDKLLDAGWSLIAARKICIVGGMIVSSSIALAAIAPWANVAIALFCLSYASIAFTGASFWSLPSDVAPTKAHVASLAGIQNFAGNLAGFFVATFTGVLVAVTHGSRLDRRGDSPVRSRSGTDPGLISVNRFREADN